MTSCRGPWALVWAIIFIVALGVLLYATLSEDGKKWGSWVIWTTSIVMGICLFALIWLLVVELKERKLNKRIMSDTKIAVKTTASFENDALLPPPDVVGHGHRRRIEDD